MASIIQQARDLYNTKFKQQGLTLPQLKATTRQAGQNLQSFFQPQTGTLAKTGQRFLQAPLSKPLQKPADIALSFGTGVEQSFAPFGINRQIRKAVGFKPEYQSQSKLGSAAQLGGNIAGFLIPGAPLPKVFGAAGSLGTKGGLSLASRAPQTSGLVSRALQGITPILGKEVAQTATALGLSKLGDTKFDTKTDLAIGLGLSSIPGVGKMAGNISRTKKLGELMKQGQALGFKGISPKVSKIHPDDISLMEQFYDQVKFSKKGKQPLGQLGKDAQNLAEYYFGKKWKHVSNQKLADTFAWAIDLNRHLPREARGAVPKVGLLSDSLKVFRGEGGNAPRYPGGSYGPGKYYSLTKDLAKKFGSQVNETFLNPKNSLIIKDQQGLENTVRDAIGEGFENITEYAKAKGYQYVIDDAADTAIDLSQLGSRIPGTAEVRSALARRERLNPLPKMGIVGDQAESAPVSILNDIKAGFKTGEKALKQGSDQAKGSLNQKFRTQFVDRLTPVYDLVKEAGKSLPAEQNPYKRMRLLAGVSGKVEATINQGLGPILKREADRLDDLSALLVFDRERELIGRGLKRARTQEQILQGVEELKKTHGAEGFATLQKSASEVRQFGGQLLQSLNESGIISNQTFNSIKAKNQFYVPFEIIEHLSDNLEKGNVIKSSFNVASQDVIKTISDSTSAVGDPLQALLRKTSKVIALVEKNKAMQSLVNMRTTAPDTVGQFIKPLKIAENPGKGFGVINLFVDGQNVRYSVPEVVESAIKNIDAQQSNLLVKMLSPQAKLLRAGATGLNIGFIPANIVRDIADAVTTEASERGVKGVVSLLRAYPAAVFSAASKGDLYQQWLKAGGAQSTLTEQVFDKSPQTLAKLSGKKDMVKTILSSPKSLVEFANRVGEQSTRLARFKSGLETGESVTEAAFKSRDITLDFAKAGDKIKLLNKVIPFLNASVQGTEKLFRLYKENPKAAIASTTALFGVPAVTLYAHNSQFEDFQDIPSSERQVYWIIIARDRTPEEKEAGEPVHGIKIPKGFLGRPVASLTDSALDFAKQKDPKTFANFVMDTLEASSPVGVPVSHERLGRTLSSTTPPIFKAAYEGFTNRNLFFNQPIVPQKLQGVAPEEQYKDSTSLAARALGKTFGISPLHIENAVSTTAGGLGRQALQLASGDIGKASVGQISRRFVGIRGGKGTDTKFEQVDKYSQESKTEKLKKTREAETTWETLKQLPKGEAAAQFNQLINQNPGLAKKVLEVYKDENLGLESIDKSVKSLTVEDGSRAKYIYNQLNKLRTREEKAQYYGDLIKKKLITKDVAQQIVYLVQQGGGNYGQ